ncbi:MAG: trypsin-like peptidase domain-containing protein [Sphaerobacter sp.]|nr:trypsin-like peptidase domain-containing protein [Sphaerobacter sp.]
MAVLVLWLMVAGVVPAAADDPAAEPDSLPWLGAEAVKYPPLGPAPAYPDEPLGEVYVPDAASRDRLRAGHFNEPVGYQTVFPPDERVRISPTVGFPTSAVVFLGLYDRFDNFIGFCSGNFIGPDVVLTAAHCLWDTDVGGWIANVRVVPGRDGVVEPYGWDLGESFWVPTGWIQSAATADELDWGLVKLPSPALGYATGWFQLGVLTTQSLLDPSFQPTTVGYPGDKPLGTMWATVKPAFLAVDHSTLYHDLDMYPGQSGSAVFRGRDGVIVGINVRQTAGWNEASRLNTDFIAFLNSACGQMGCNFSYFVESAGGGGGGGGNGVRPTFDALTPGPFSVVPPGTVTIGASAHSDSAIASMTMLIGDREFTSNTNTVTAQLDLPPGVYVVAAQAIDADGDAFEAVWDIIVSPDPGEGEWFTSSGAPKAEQINATMRSLVEAFRWHLFGQSWDGAPHPDLPSHAAFAGQAPPLGAWVGPAGFDRAATEATLRSLVEAFRWHFWGVSWDGGAHCDMPTHAACTAPQGPQGLDPWFTPSGEPIPANITATLRSLVEAFRWHFWRFSWDGGHHDDLPTH